MEDLIKNELNNRTNALKQNLTSEIQGEIIALSELLYLWGEKIYQSNLDKNYKKLGENFRTVSKINGIDEAILSIGISDESNTP